VEAECLDSEAIPKLKINIKNALSKKLSQPLQDVHWLCITVDDATYPEDLDWLFLDTIFSEYQSPLLEKEIEKIYFVGYQAVFKEHVVSV